MQPDRETTRIELVLECEAQPIRGALLAGGTRRAFTGWVELASALEIARRRSAITTTNEVHPVTKGEPDDERAP